MKNTILTILSIFLLASTATAQLVVNMNTVMAEEGQIIDIELTVQNFEDVVSAQFSLNWNDEVLQFEEIHAFGIDGMNESENFGVPPETAGDVITFSWYDNDVAGVDVEDDAVLFKVKFKVIGEGGSMSPVELTGSPTAIEVMDIANNVLDLTIDQGLVEVNPNSVETIYTPDFALHSNSPNPFKGATSIQFDLFKASNAALSIYDTSGKLIFEQQERYGSGTHTITLDKGIFPAAGTYFYTLTTDFAQATRQMNFVK